LTPLLFSSSNFSLALEAFVLTFLFSYKNKRQPLTAVAAYSPLPPSPLPIHHSPFTIAHSPFTIAHCPFTTSPLQIKQSQRCGCHND
jgi:hypothetical protein